MSSRSVGTPPASIGEIARLSRRRRLAFVALCISSSVGMAGFLARVVNQTARTTCLQKQDLQQRHFVIPFDQRRHRAKACNGLPIQAPNLVTEPRAVIVDAKDGAVG